MSKLRFTIKLISDAELGTGFGSNLLDGVIPRDINDAPIIPAAHIKGLMKQALLDVPADLNQALGQAITAIFGKSGGHLKNNGLFHLTDGIISQKDIDKTARNIFDRNGYINNVTRTALNEFGTAKDMALRTNEAIACGVVFTGTLTTQNNLSPALEDLIRYSLLAITEIGGSRNRGCGACHISIEDEKRLPGEILLSAINADLAEDTISTNLEAGGDHHKRILTKIHLTAQGALCLPELPTIGNNTICSGWTIPASAVQGMILTNLNNYNPRIADECFKSELFRAWPLLPIPQEKANNGIPVRASASHKISKLANKDDRYTFCDEKIEAYDWSNTSKNAPIKSADGVLIKEGQDITLWRSGDMARNISAHGVINGESNNGTVKRNLFTVESIAITDFVGFLSLPEDAFKLLEMILQKDNIVHIGKSRSIRGTATIEVQELNELPLDLPHTSKDPNTKIAAFIVQSPILLDVAPNTANKLSANELLLKVLEKNLKEAGCTEMPKLTDISASTQILFGWNRHKNTGEHDNGQEDAKLVIAPGSVFVLPQLPDNWSDFVLKGIGEGRDRGYGAILPHPGIATNRYSEKIKNRNITDNTDYAEIAWNLWKKATQSGLSTSQVSKLLQLLKRGVDIAIDYLQKQLHGRKEIYDRWVNVADDVRNLLKDDPEKATKTFKVWYDLMVASNSKEER